MIHAVLIRLDKTAMQSGKRGMRPWRLRLLPASPQAIDPLMGWTSMRDTVRELDLRFPSKEAALAYAHAQGIDVQVREPHARTQQRKAYADNFRFKA